MYYSIHVFPNNRKPITSSKPPVASKPQSKPKPEIPVVDEFPEKPSEGQTAIKGGAYWDYGNGKWWVGEGVDREVVDDSDKTYPPCETCGQPQGHCTCRTGF